MKVYSERTGINRRQFLKGSGLLLVTAIFSGVFAKIGFDALAASYDYIQERIGGLYSLDEQMTLRKSHENVEILQLYQEFLSPGEVKPLSEKAHHLLHTRYGRDIPALIQERHGSDHNAA